MAGKRLCQVWIIESNENGPLKVCRNSIDNVKTKGLPRRQMECARLTGKDIAGGSPVI